MVPRSAVIKGNPARSRERRRSNFRVPGGLIGLAVLSFAQPVLAHAGHGAPSYHLTGLLPAPDLAIALCALGLAIGRLDSDGLDAPMGMLVGTLAAGMLAGLAAGGRLPEITRAAPLIAAGGLLLLPAEAMRPVQHAWLALTAVVLGLHWGHQLPSLPGWPLFLGAAAAGGSLAVFAIAYLWHRAYKPWFPIAARILGSWMVAIGMILLGASVRP